MIALQVPVVWRDAPRLLPSQPSPSKARAIGRPLPHASTPFARLRRPGRGRVHAVHFTIDSFSKKYLEQRLVGDIPLVRETLQLSQECRGEPQRDRFGRWLEIGKYSHAGLAPVDERARIVRLPGGTFLSLRAKRRNGFTNWSLGHNAFFRDDSSGVPRSREVVILGS